MKKVFFAGLICALFAACGSNNIDVPFEKISKPFENLGLKFENKTNQGPNYYIASHNLFAVQIESLDGKNVKSAAFGLSVANPTVLKVTILTLAIFIDSIDTTVKDEILDSIPKVIESGEMKTIYKNSRYWQIQKLNATMIQISVS